MIYKLVSSLQGNNYTLLSQIYVYAEISKYTNCYHFKSAQDWIENLHGKMEKSSHADFPIHEGKFFPC